MDGDVAGQTAVERLCGNLNSMLPKVPNLNRNELYVATLPPEAKDPSDYVDLARGGPEAGRRFAEEVLDAAVPWDEWHVARLLSRHDADAADGTRGSFSDVCEEASIFLATFPNPADRTRRAYGIAGRLAELLVGDDPGGASSSSLGMLRVQLESDMLGMSSRGCGRRWSAGSSARTARAPARPAPRWRS